MHERLATAGGERMDLDTYLTDFQQHFWGIDQHGFWKLERQQFFQEPGNASWEAFARGEWEEALRLLEDGRAELEDEQRRIAQQGFSINRVRVVEEPIIPYLQWELHLLRLREECGTHIRVIGPTRVAQHEAAEPLPEIVVLGTTVMYEVIYDEQGILAGGRRYSDPQLITSWRRLISELFDAGEPLAYYFRRCVANLSAPRVQQIA